MFTIADTLPARPGGSAAMVTALNFWPDGGGVLRRPQRFDGQYYRPGATDPVSPAFPMTELRTHGVSGSPPEVLVNDPHPLFVSGDQKAGFYRRLAPPEIGPERNIEAYSWSAISSRARTRAFWLLLFPFAMVNYAGWMVGPKPNGSWERAILRLIGLALTIHYTLWAMVVFVDLLAYQCGGSPACRGQYLLGWFNSTIGFLGSSPLRHAVLFSLIPMLVVGLLVWTTRSDPADYERWPEHERGTARVDRTLLQDPLFWQAPWTTRRLAEAHGVAALAAVGAVLAGVARTVTAGARPELAGLEIALWGLCAAAAAVVLAAGWVRHPPADAARWGRAIRMTGLAAAPSVSAVGALSWNASIDPGSLPPVLDPLRDAFDGVMIAQFALLMLYYLKDQPRMFLAIPAIGSALYSALSRPRSPRCRRWTSCPGRCGFDGCSRPWELHRCRWESTEYATV